MKAGKLKAREVKDFLRATYQEYPPKDLDGYLLDNELSTDTAKVYYNPQTGQAVVAHRGTKGTADWGNNLAYALGAYEKTDRFKKGKSVQNKAEQKYGKQNISTLGHSQSAAITRKVGSDTKEIINVNPAYLFELPKKNEYNVRSSSDIFSSLYAPVSKAREVLYPKYSKKHDITIPSQSATDILGEHSYNILDRMGDAEIGVGAGNKISTNSIMKPKMKKSKVKDLSGGAIDPGVAAMVAGIVGLPTMAALTSLYLDHFAGRQNLQIEPAPTPPETPASSAVPSPENSVHSSLFDLSVGSDNDIEMGRGRTGGRRAKALGYSGDNINWCGGAVDKNPDPTAKRYYTPDENQHLAVPRRELNPDDFEFDSEEEDENDGRLTADQVNEFLTYVRNYPPREPNRRSQFEHLVGQLEGQIENIGQNEENDDSIRDLMEEIDEMMLTDFVGNGRGGTRGNRSYGSLQDSVARFQARLTRLGNLFGEQFDENAFDVEIEDIEEDLEQMYLAQEQGNKEEAERIATSVVEQLQEMKKEVDNFEKEMTVHKVSESEESSSDEEEEEEGAGRGGKLKNPFKGAQKAFTKMGTAFGKAGETLNPMSYAIKDKGTRQAMVSSGDVTQNYLLPATVSAGKPIFDATAATASTMLTGNPVLGKVAADTLWNKMVADKGYDPRERQKSKELGELSSTFGKAASKPFAASLGGKRERRIDLDEEFTLRDRQRRGFRIPRPEPISDEPITNEEINEIFGQLPQNVTTEAAGRKKGRKKGGTTYKEQLKGELDKLPKKVSKSIIEDTDDLGEFNKTANELEERLKKMPKASLKKLLDDGKLPSFKTKKPIFVEFPDQMNEDIVDAFNQFVSEPSGKGRVDFEKVKWGTFERMFKDFKKEHPRARVKDLEQFADYVIKNKKKFSEKALKKAHFYKNIIKK